MRGGDINLWMRKERSIEHAILIALIYPFCMVLSRVVNACVL